MTVQSVLDNLHNSLCDDARRANIERAVFVIECFRLAEVISYEEARLRKQSLASCPGHKGSRVWCAYCGNVPPTYCVKHGDHAPGACPQCDELAEARMILSTVVIPPVEHCEYCEANSPCQYPKCATSSADAPHQEKP